MKQSFYGQFMSIIFLMLVGTLPSIFAQKSANFQDCIEAFPICQMKTYHFGNMKGVGNISDQPKESKCFGSAFQVDILFKLTPYSGHIDPPDDLVVYAA
jgi:hypothetical protein